MTNELTEKTFENLKKIKDSVECWSARDLYPVLGYATWQKFEAILKKAMIACKNSQISVFDHFNQTVKLIDIGKGGQREMRDYLLTRYACYLVIQNADPNKEVIALAQTYFAVQTRKQELQEQSDMMKDLSENQKRLYLREEMKTHNKSLVKTAHEAGVISSVDYINFQNSGYQGLYNGMTAYDIKRHKNLKDNEKILDHMGSTELAANLFRATQTEDKLKRENIKGKQNANRVHFQVEAKVRKTIEELGGTMPEDLPAVESIHKIKKQEKLKKISDK